MLNTLCINNKFRIWQTNFTPTSTNERHLIIGAATVNCLSKLYVGFFMIDCRWIAIKNCDKNLIHKRLFDNCCKHKTGFSVYHDKNRLSKILKSLVLETIFRFYRFTVSIYSELKKSSITLQNVACPSKA